MKNIKIRKLIGNILFWISHGIFGLYTLIFLKRRVVEYQKDIKGPVIYASNHPSTTDPFYLIGILMKPISILVSELVFQMKLVGLVLKWANHIRTGGKYNKEAYKKSIEMLRAGKSVLIMPEGKICIDKRHVGTLHTGAVRMALETHVPIVPIGIAIDESKIKLKPYKINEKPLDQAHYYFLGKYVMVIGKARMINGHVNDKPLVIRETEMLQKEINRLIEIAYSIKNITIVGV